MTLPKITKRNNPKRIQEKVRRYQVLLEQALELAIQRGKSKSRDIRKMLSTARVEGLGPGYKVIPVAFPNPKYKSTWYANYSFAALEDMNTNELADWIVGTASENIRISKTKDPQYMAK